MGEHSELIHVLTITHYIMKTYYHVIEEGDYGRVASHGYYTKLSDAEKEVARLSSFFEGTHFYVLETNSKKEPSIVTI